MKRKHIVGSILGIAVLSAAGGAAWILSLPQPQPARIQPPVPSEEADAALAALKPPKKARPLIAIIGANAGTEVNDYLLACGILRRANVADVLALSTEAGPVNLYPCLKVQPDATIAEFDRDHPEGADYIIVPAMSRDDDPAVLQWVRSQRNKRATVIGVCAGAKVVAATGLLDGKRGTSHWYYLKQLLREHPDIHYIADRRWIVDDRIVTTTGITASVPLSLTLIEAIAGRERAAATARECGVKHWDARHDSQAFRFTRPFALTALKNRLAFWKHEKLGFELTPGMDEVSVALVADAWSRTYRSHAVTFAGTAGPQTMRYGMRIIPDEVASSWPEARRIGATAELKPTEALDQTLQQIAARYDSATAKFVAMQLEYPQPQASQRNDASTAKTQ